MGAAILNFMTRYGCRYRPFARWRHFTTTTRIHFVFLFKFKFVIPGESEEQ